MKDEPRTSNQRPDLKYIGGYYPKELKQSVAKIARAERRSVSKMVQIFLEEGVKHREASATKAA